MIDSTNFHITPDNTRVKPGDVVMRLLAGVVEQRCKVISVKEGVIEVAGGWMFDVATGCEIDEYLGWGPPPLETGSFLDSKRTEYQSE